MIYPVNFVGHVEWIKSDYALNIASGVVITREGDVLREWRVGAYDLKADDEGEQYDFIIDGQAGVMFLEEFSFLNFRASRGLALSNLRWTIREWHEATVP